MANTTWLGSVMSGSASLPAPRFCVGDKVAVLVACHLPVRETVMGEGVIAKITGTTEPLYWVDGFMAARTAKVLRLIQSAR